MYPDGGGACANTDTLITYTSRYNHVITYVITMLRGAVGLVLLGRVAVSVRVGLRRLLWLVVGLARVTAVGWLLLMIHWSATISGSA